jgi:hypothetical protein
MRSYLFMLHLYLFMLHLDKSDEQEGEIISVYVAPGQE